MTIEESFGYINLDRIDGINRIHTLGINADIIISIVNPVNPVKLITSRNTLAARVSSNPDNREFRC